ncbi:hypothetical protein BVC80_1553g17 [Macleaya cordata]|uniref:Uncharacterized protein n=1 Tax=Macleaya cordata TaxID=56857 RepID=A0A200QY79_MACCD|nr:hypothetical protein BVC80_1553g17 [Macleaya cordata]
MVLIIRFKSFVLGILFILLAFGDISIAHTQQLARDKKAVGTENGFSTNGGNVVTVDQEFFDGVPTAAAAAKNKKLGGRKMLVGDNVLSNKEMMKQEAAAGLINGEAASKISGLGKVNASAKSLERSQEMTTDQESDDDLISDQKTESQKLLEAANNEIANLMQRDYPGMGRPRRKPPINNRHEPLDEDHINP